VIIAHPGGGSPGSTGPQGACLSNDDTRVRSSHPQKGGSDTIPAAAEALQRIRERLELEAIATGSSRPEQIADALLREGVGR
jgi:hypothetical protein